MVLMTDDGLIFQYEFAIVYIKPNRDVLLLQIGLVRRIVYTFQMIIV